jgi:hypothetical protein
MDKDPIQELIEYAEAAEAEKPWNKFPALWFVVSEIAALGIVFYAASYFGLREYAQAFTDWLLK